jgi:hypothetical protein
MLEYEELTEPERAIWNAIETGAVVILPLGPTTADDAANGETWGQDRQVRAQLLYELLAGGNGPKDIRPRALKLTGARITGTLDLEAATLTCPLSLDRCYFDQPINLREAHAPAVSLSGCHMPGLDAEQFQTQGNLVLDDGFTVTGVVSLNGAHIGGSLIFAGATLTNPDGVALGADALTVNQGMFCHGSTVQGEIRLLSTHIGTQLAFTAATLTNPGGVALGADGLTVDQAMFCDQGFTAEGEVRLAEAHIGGQLVFVGAALTNPNGVALHAGGVTAASVMCYEPFVAEGEIGLIDARIANELNLTGAVLINPDGLVLDLERARIGTLFLRPEVPPAGTVDLRNAHVDTCVDNEATWPEELYLIGFTYGSLVAEPEVEVAARLRWLERDPHGYIPQLYEQLATAYRKAGRNEDARKVAIAKQRRRRQTLNLPGRALNTLLRWTVGYGYQTWKAGVWLLVLVGLGWWIFDRAHPAQLIAATPLGQRPWFHAGLYTLDLLLPFVDLGYQDAWIAAGWARGFHLAWNVAGWVLITAVVAALSGLIKRD